MMRLISIGIMIAFCGMLPLPVHAYMFSIDEFSVAKNGNLIFSDSFDDGTPPPIAPNYTNGAPAEYAVAGTMGPEIGGKLALNSTGAEPRVNPLGDDVYFMGATLKTNIDQNNLTSGLKIDDTFSVTGIFDLNTPTVPMEAYGVRLTDHISPSPNQMAQLVIMRDLSNDLSITYREADWGLGTFTLIDMLALDLSHEQIALTLAREDVLSNAITASFAYIDGGIMGTTFTFANTADIFDGENFTRAQFFAATNIPEPSTLFLLGSGLFGLVAFRKKFRN